MAPAVATPARERRRRPRTRSMEMDSLFTALPERSTLEDAVLGVWEDLSGDAATSCLVCGGAMEPRYSAGPSAVGGQCRDCGSSID